MYDEDAVQSGLSLAREEDAASEAPGKPAGEAPKIEVADLSRRMGELRKKKDAGTLSAEDVAYMKEVAKDKTLPVGARYLSNCFLSVWRRGEGDLLRALYYMETALFLAQSSSQRATCHQEIFSLKRDMGGGKLTPECMEDYEQFAEAAVEGICSKDAEAILLVLETGTAEKMEDYALLAAAAKAWSVHPENRDDFDREEAEAKYYRCIKAFKEQECKGYTEAIYQYYHGQKCSNGNNAAVKWRKKLIQGKPAQEGAAVSGSPAAQSDSGGAAPNQKAKKKTLQDAVEQFRQKYPNAVVATASEQCILEYASVARKIVKALRSGDIELMKYMVDHPEVFEGMQDYMLLGSAALLLFMHPKNTDVGRRMQARKQGEIWLERSLKLSEPDDHYPLNLRWDRMSSINARELKSEWTELLKYVLAKLQQMQ